MPIGEPKTAECPERRNMYLIDTDERLSKFLTIDKRARQSRQEDDCCFKRRKYRRLGSNQQLKLRLSKGLATVTATVYSSSS